MDFYAPLRVWPAGSEFGMLSDGSAQEPARKLGVGRIVPPYKSLVLVISRYSKMDEFSRAKLVSQLLFLRTANQIRFLVLLV